MSARGNHPPFSIVPTQSVAAAQPMHPPHQQQQGAARVSPTRARPAPSKAVDLQFSQVLSARMQQDREVDELRKALDDRHREINALSDKLSRANASASQYKGRLHHDIDVLKNEHIMEVDQLRRQQETERRETSDLLLQLRQNVAALNNELRSRQATHGEEIRRLQQENHRLEVIADQCKIDANRTVNDMELELDKQTSMLAEQDKELSLKEEQMRKAKKEVATMRENLEKVAKELVGRNKERDAEIQRRQHQYEMEARRMGDELSSLIQDKRELTRVEIEQKDEILMLKAQLDKAQLTHAELVQEVSSGRNQLTLKEKADEINQREINDALQQLDAMKQENNNLHLMMERLNEQLRRASEDITRSQEQMNRLRDQITEQEDEMTQTHHDRAAFAAKLVRASEAATEETKRIVEEVDSFRVMAREAAIQHAPAESRDLEMELLREQNRERAEKTEQAAKAARHHGDEQAAVMLLTRLREDLVLAWEDLRVVRSDIADEISRYNDLHAQHLALKEAYIVDREHLATLTTNLNEANVAFSKLQKEKQAMHQALAKEDEWMQECMKMSAEREANQAALRQENAVLQDQLTRLKEVAGSAEIDQRLSAVRYENERLTAETWEARRRRSEAEDALVAAQDDLAQARRDIDLMRKSQALNQTDDASSRGRLIELETEVDVLKKINDELQAKLDRSKQREHAAEAENKQLRDERFELRHKLDDLQSRTTAAESSDGHRQRMIAQQLQDDQHSISHLRSSRDDADRRAIRLEEERAHLTGHLNHLKSETAALAQGMRDASVENDQLKQIAGITPARNRGGASPVSPTMSNPGGPGGAYPRPSSPYDKALSQQDEALRDIQNRVSSLVNAMAWGR